MDAGIHWKPLEADSVMTDGSDRELDALVSRLELLRDGEQLVRDLIAQGPKAIAPLRRFLIDGRPSVTCQPRQRAVEALAGLHAKEVLMEYIRQPRHIPNPVTRLAEEAVEITAARALRAWPTPEVVALLLELAGAHLQPGILETLGEFRVREAIPFFIFGLEDDVCRSAAEGALRKLGAPAQEALVDAALSAAPSKEGESPSSLRRRRSAMRLLAEMKLAAREVWPRLSRMLEESDPDLLVSAAQMAAGAGSPAERGQAMRSLLAAWPSADWRLQEQIGGCLIELCPDSPCE
ncbi:MAG: hypothetical protein HY922_13435 [Elusimicrobia bacterium]|nr:hypothetical protein [Elusimicrobiota bacterium]